MDLATWFRRWLSTHPLREPLQLDRAHYTAEVMQRVKGAPEPAPIYVVRWTTWPRLALATAAVAAVALLVVGRVGERPVQMATTVEDDLNLLAALDEPALVEGVDAEDLEALAQELETNDVLLLAEAQPSDEQWLDETLLLLDQVDEDVPEDAVGDGADDQWLDELQLLDEQELSVSS